MNINETIAIKSPERSYKNESKRNDINELFAEQKQTHRLMIAKEREEWKEGWLGSLRWTGKHCCL